MPSTPVSRTISRHSLSALRLASRILRPPDYMMPDEWAAKYRSHPPTAAIPGPRDPRLTPYVVPVEHAVAKRLAKRIVCVFGAQTGKSELLLDCAGARL